MASFTEENYIKAIYHLAREESGGVSTTGLAKFLQTKASSVTDMLKKLAAKDWINYKKYQGVTLTEQGKQEALKIIRKHRLWEVFLMEKLHFKWDEVHEYAEELEHVGSEELINRLEQFLEFPKFDPHGDPIPDRNGMVYYPEEVLLSELQAPAKGIIIGVKDSSSTFLLYLENIRLVLGTEVEVKECFEYDHSMRILANGEERTISHQVCKNLVIKKQSIA